MPEKFERDEETSPGAQRLDKWLWFARVVKTRTLAQQLVATGRVRVNRERTEKPSHGLRLGDVVTATVQRRVRVLRVLELGVRRGPPAEAARLFEELTPSPPVAKSRVASSPEGGGELAPTSGPQLHREPGSGRPTKRDRRRIDKFTSGEG
jgi:ribosome-associated heat shock protein Hsp15